MAAHHAAGPAFIALPFFLFFCRSPTQALLRWLFPSAEVHSHPLHQPLSWPLHHIHHWGQCHHYVNGALQPAKGKSHPSMCWLWNRAVWGSRGPEDHTLFPWDTVDEWGLRPALLPWEHTLLFESLSRLQARHCNPSNSRPALPFGSHLPQPKAWFPCSCVKKQRIRLMESELNFYYEKTCPNISSPDPSRDWPSDCKRVQSFRIFH